MEIIRLLLCLLTIATVSAYDAAAVYEELMNHDGPGLDSLSEFSTEIGDEALLGGSDRLADRSADAASLFTVLPVAPGAEDACEEIELRNFTSSLQSMMYWELNTSYFIQPEKFNGRPYYRTSSFHTFLFYSTVQVKVYEEDEDKEPVPVPTARVPIPIPQVTAGQRIPVPYVGQGNRLPVFRRDRLAAAAAGGGGDVVVAAPIRIGVRSPLGQGRVGSGGDDSRPSVNDSMRDGGGYAASSSTTTTSSVEMGGTWKAPVAYTSLRQQLPPLVSSLLDVVEELGRSEMVGAGGTPLSSHPSSSYSVDASSHAAGAGGVGVRPWNGLSPPPHPKPFRISHDLLQALASATDEEARVFSAAVRMSMMNAREQAVHSGNVARTSARSESLSGPDDASTAGAGSATLRGRSGVAASGPFLPADLMGLLTGAFGKPKKYTIKASTKEYWVIADTLASPAKPIAYFYEPAAAHPVAATQPVEWKPESMDYPYFVCHTRPPALDPRDCPIVEVLDASLRGTEAFSSLYYYRDPSTPKPTRVSAKEGSMAVPSEDPPSRDMYPDFPIYDGIFGSKIFYAGSKVAALGLEKAKRHPDNMHGWVIGTSFGWRKAAMVAQTEVSHPSQVPEGRWSSELIGMGPMSGAVVKCHETAPWNPDSPPVSTTKSCWGGRDIIVAIDFSGSMSGREVAELRSFIRSTVSQLLLEDDPAAKTQPGALDPTTGYGTRIGLVTFGQLARTSLNLTGSMTKFTEALGMFNRYDPWLGTSTATGDALVRMEEMFEASGRPTSERVYVLAVDGGENSPSLPFGTERRVTMHGKRILKDTNRSRIVSVVVTEGMSTWLQEYVIKEIKGVTSSTNGPAVAPSFKLLEDGFFMEHFGEAVCGIERKDSDCVISKWMPWSECSELCGNGTQMRVRYVVRPEVGTGQACSTMGPMTENRTCGHESCTTQCQVSDWGPWSDCPTDCGVEGTRSKNRTILVQPAGDADPCPELSFTAECPVTPCPIDCNASEWGVPADRYGVKRDAEGWEDCVGECREDAFQIRRRAVWRFPDNGGADCPPLYEIRPCASLPACDEECAAVGAWGNYSECEPCTAHPDSPLCQHSTLGDGSGGGSSAVNVADSVVGSMCDGVITRVRLSAPRGTVATPADVASGMPVLIGAGSSATADDGLACPQNVEYIPCHLDSACPVDCLMSTWAAEPCRARCGKGKRRSVRTILRHPSGGGTECPTDLEKEEDCDSEVSCTYDCNVSSWRDASLSEYHILTAIEGLVAREVVAKGDGSSSGANNGGEVKEVSAEELVEMIEAADIAMTDFTNTIGTVSGAPPGDDGAAVGIVSVGGGGTVSGMDSVPEHLRGLLKSVGLLGCSAPCGGGVILQTRSISSTRPSPWVLGKCPPLGRQFECNPEPCPVDCRTGPWSEYGACSASCDGGKANRTRVVVQEAQHGGQQCGSLIDLLECNTAPCPVDCEVSDFGSFTDCSERCGGGTMRRVRSILKRAAHGGAECPPLEETVPCNLDPCTPTPEAFTTTPSGTPTPPSDCLVTPLLPVGNCSTKCGNGTQMYRREVVQSPTRGGEPCPELFEIRPCEGTDCSVDCVLSPWGNWSGCSAVCGGGERSRTRTVETEPVGEGRKCDRLTDTDPCNTSPCAVDCKVKWREGPCSVDCGDGGVIIRQADVIVEAAHGGLPCPAVLVETLNCSGPQPCPVDCVLSAFSEWGECEGSCNPPAGWSKRTRTVEVEAVHGGVPCSNFAHFERRACKPKGCPPCGYSDWSDSDCPLTGMGTSGGSGKAACGENVTSTSVRSVLWGSLDECDDTTKVVPCNLPPCAPVCTNPKWSEWTPCSSTQCGKVGYQSRSLRYDGDPAECHGSTEQRPCMEACKPVCKYSEWSPMSPCDAPCGFGVSKKTRIAIATPPGEVCSDLEFAEPCFITECNYKCIAGVAGNWSACSATCGGGVRTRTRQSTRPQGAPPTLQCSSTVETSPCAEVPCSKPCEVGDWSEWSDCSAASCGSRGHRTRRREILQVGYGVPCPYTVEVEECEAWEWACGAACIYGPWEEWGTCSAKCGGGVRTRKRAVLEDAADGIHTCNATTESEPCGLADCPIDCVMGEFGDWHGCTGGCHAQKGTEIRTRSVVTSAAYGGKPCTEPLAELRECTAVDAPPCAARADQDSAYSVWDEWGPCVRACGEGWQHRDRVPLTEAPVGTAWGRTHEYRVCNGSSVDAAADSSVGGVDSLEVVDECSPEIGWSDWREVGQCAAKQSCVAPTEVLVGNQSFYRRVESGVLTSQQRDALETVSRGDEECTVSVCEPPACVASRPTQWGKCDPCSGVRHRVSVVVYPSDAALAVGFDKLSGPEEALERMNGIERCRADHDETEECEAAEPCDAICQTTPWIRGACAPKKAADDDTHDALSCVREGERVATRTLLPMDPRKYRLLNCSAVELQKVEVCRATVDCCKLSAWRDWSHCDVGVVAGLGLSGPWHGGIQLSTDGRLPKAGVAEPVRPTCGSGLERRIRVVESTTAVAGYPCDIIPMVVGGSATNATQNEDLVFEERRCHVDCPVPVDPPKVPPPQPVVERVVTPIVPKDPPAAQHIVIPHRTPTPTPAVAAVVGVGVKGIGSEATRTMTVDEVLVAAAAGGSDSSLLLILLLLLLLMLCVLALVVGMYMQSRKRAMRTNTKKRIMDWDAAALRGRNPEGTTRDAGLEDLLKGVSPESPTGGSKSDGMEYSPQSYNPQPVKHLPSTITNLSMAKKGGKQSSFVKSRPPGSPVGSQARVVGSPTRTLHAPTSPLRGVSPLRPRAVGGAASPTRGVPMRGVGSPASPSSKASFRDDDDDDSLEDDDTSSEESATDSEFEDDDDSDDGGDLRKK